ncbi:MAG TPA: NusG domain II-containing protein [Rectinemataceae bacterium]
MKLRLVLKPLDLAILAVCLVVVILISLSVFKAGGDELYVHITAASGEWIESLDQEKELEIAGPLGSTFVHIHKGEVEITDSACDNKLCVNMGTISKEHQWIACLPNDVFVEIGGKSSDPGGLDAATF